MRKALEAGAVAPWNIYIYSIQTGSGAHSTPCLVGTDVYFFGVKRLGREVEHSVSCNVEVENARSYYYTPPYVFAVWCLIMYSDKLLYLIHEICGADFFLRR
jgi:hypothetical protein